MIGETFSHYKILEKLGEGGMGVVYKAEDTKLKRSVAIKFLPTQIASDETARERFMIEAQAAAALNHPNIATIYAVEEAEDSLFIVMEYVKGKTLKKKIETDPYTYDEAMKFAKQVAEGLYEAHKNGVVHRDIKTSNIMLTESGQAKIMDFGLAKITESSVITKDGSTLGTAAYMSPEQAKGDKVDHRTDIWSFGIVLFEMLCGRRPFKGEYEQALIYSILNTDPDAATSIVSGLPDEVDNFFAKVFLKNPDERIRTFREVIDYLESLYEGRDITTSPVQSKPEPKTETKSKTKSTHVTVDIHKSFSKKVLVSGTAVAVIAFIAFFIWILPSFTGGGGTLDSIAVLALENNTGDPALDYLSSGISRGISNRLSHSPDLKVISTSSLQRYTGKTVDAETVADEVNVKAVVMGVMNLIEENIIVDIELKNGRDNSIIWGERYSSPRTSLQDMETSLTKQIIEALNIQFSGEQETSMTKKHTDNPAAWDFYKKGRDLLEKRTVEDIRKAKEYFEQAIRIDPDFALAYSGKADAIILKPYYETGFLPLQDFSEVKKEIEKALQLDPSLAEAHSTLGYIQYFEGMIEEGRRSFEIAIALKPNYSQAYHWYGEVLNLIEGKPQEAVEKCEKALELDPQSIVVNRALAMCYSSAEEHDKGIRQAERAVKLDPEYAFSYWSLSKNHRVAGNFDKAREAVSTALELNVDHPILIMESGLIFMSRNENSKAAEQFRKIKKSDPSYGISRLRLGVSYLISKDYEKSLQSFNEIPPDDENYAIGLIFTALTFHRMRQYKMSINITVQTAKAVGVPFIDKIYDQTFTGRKFNKETYQEFFINYIEEAKKINHPLLNQPTNMAFIYLYAGEINDVFIELNKWYSFVPEFLLLPFFDPVRPDPRFVELMEKTGLSRYYK
ncbi:protein kinase [candidate division KSB1 bacterium]